MLASLLVCLTSCGGGGGSDSGPINGGAGTSPRPNATYVDPQNGIDSSDRGSTLSLPVKTISFAKTVPNTKYIILLDGTYSTQSGEKFPITIPNGISLIGQNFVSKGASSIFPKIIGCGIDPTLNIAVGVILDGGTFEYAGASCPDGIGLVAKSTTEKYYINNSVFYNSVIGAYYLGSGTTTYSAAYQNSGTGFYHSNQSDAEFFDNVSTENAIGALVERNAKITFLNKTNTTGMALLKNTLCDFRYFGDSDLSLYGTIWDDADSAFSASRQCSGGNNISIEGTGSVKYGETSNPTTPAFPSAKLIDLIFPIDSSLVSSSAPTLKWSPNGSKLSAIAVFSKIPIINEIGIENTGDVLWYWHSGLGGGGSGQISWSRGVTPSGGVLDSGVAAQSLTPGRTYYWIAWEWSETTGRITASSPIGIFRVQP
jgi:hypothetical protein